MQSSARSVGRILALFCCLIISTSAHAVLNGTYTVGGGSPDYATISAAVSALNSQGISGPVDFAIRTGTYDEQATIQNFFRSGSADDEVTFRKEFLFSSITWQYSGASGASNYVLKLDGAKHISIRGIHFVAAGTPFNGTLIRVNDNTESISIISAEFTGLAGSSSSDLILKNESGLIADLTFIGNTFRNGIIAIDMDLTTTFSGLVIQGNTFIDQYSGAIESRTAGAIISGNTVSDSPTSNTTYRALSITDNSAVIDSNVIHVQRGEYAIYNTVNSGEPIASGSISNNMVDSVHFGVYARASNTNVYHNTISVTGALTEYALWFFGTGLSNLSNNILTHDGAGGLALVGPASVLNISANDNNIYSAGGTPLVTWDGNDYNTLAAYQAASGLEPDSVSVAVSYVNASPPFDLHLAAPSVSSVDLAIPFLPDITVDIDGDTRSTQVTFMGADEGTGVAPLDDADANNGLFYTVGGVSPDFSDPTEAIDNLYKRGTKAPVTFRVRASTYNVHKTIKDIRRFGAADDLVLFRSSNLANQPVFQYQASGVSDNWIIRLQSADYVTFTNFVFNNLGDDLYSRLLYLEEDVDNFNLRLCTLNGATDQLDPNAALVFTGSGTAVQQDQLGFFNNTFNNGSQGLSLDWLLLNGFAPGTNLTVSNNNFTGQHIAIEAIGDNITIEKNTISSDFPNAVGVKIKDAAGFYVDANQIKLSGTASEGVKISASHGFVPPDYSGVTNNFIIAGLGISLDNESSIMYVANNSVISELIPFKANGANLGIFVSNNILSATVTGPALWYGNTLHRLELEDYNILSSATGDLINLDGVSYASFKAYRAAMKQLGKTYGLNSRELPVTFVDSTNGDLHLAGASIGDTGMVGSALVYVSTDVDADLRATSAPYIGADEAAAVQGVILSPYDFLFVSEDGTTDTFTARLASQPVNDVTFNLSVSDPSLASLDKASLSFTPANWDTAQEVVVTGKDNNHIDLSGMQYLMDHDLTIVTGPTTSLDADYQGIDPHDIALVVAETTTATLSISAGSDAAEPSTDGHFTISIDSGVTSDAETAVTVWALSGSAAETVDYTLLTLGLVIPAGANSSNIVIEPIDDPDTEGTELVILSINSISPPAEVMIINPAANTATINLQDDESLTPAGFTVTPGGGLSVSENGSMDTFTVVLDTEPGAPVSIGLSISDPSHASISHAALQFDASNWSEPQDVTVTGVDDKIISFDGGYFGQHDIAVTVATSSSTDPEYDGLNPADLGLSVVEATTTTLSIAVGEDAGEPARDGFFVLTLDNGVSSNIDTVASISMTGTSTQNIDYTLLAAGLTIPAGSSSTDVVIRVVDDPDDEGTETIIMTLTGVNHDPQAMSINPGLSSAEIDIQDDDSTGPIFSDGFE